MKVILLVPLAFLADVQGLIYFVPYMLFVMAVAQVQASARRRAREAARNRSAGSFGVVTAGDDAVLAVVHN